MDTLIDLLDIKTTLQMVMVIASIGVAISSLEDLANFQQFKDSGLLSWEVSRLQTRWTASGFIGNIVDYFLAFPRYRYVILIRLISSVLIASLKFSGAAVALLLLLIVITTFSLYVRNPYGLDGSHQMNLILFVGLFFSSLVTDGSIAKEISIWFIAAQAGLAYFVSGTSKLKSSIWRSGSALTGILSTQIYGHRISYEFLSQHSAVSMILSWMTILFECAFPAVFVVDLKYGILILAAGVLFHLSTAIIMGLNNFFWSFIATYPAILYCSLQI